MTTATAQYPLLDLLWTFVLFFALMIYFWLLITVFGDLFRRRDISGWAKAGWTVLVLVLPLVGALAYLIAQGREMAERDVRQASLARQQTDEYIRSVAAPGNRGLDEVARAKDLLDRGAISPAEFDELKRRVLV
jgi:Phospholipase_D-nuclease N-terminal/Short C-terminal domain